MITNEINEMNVALKWVLGSGAESLRDGKEERECPNVALNGYGKINVLWIGRLE